MGKEQFFRNEVRNEQAIRELGLTEGTKIRIASESRPKEKLEGSLDKNVEINSPIILKDQEGKILLDTKEVKNVDFEGRKGDKGKIQTADSVYKVEILK